jgi:hypothetical protein
VFTEPEPERRLEMLDADLRRWRIGQPLYAIGPLMTALGIGALAAATSGATRLWLMLAFVLMGLGALMWSWSVYLRFGHVEQFALGELPWWPFAGYVWLTVAALLVLGVGLLTWASPAWGAWVSVAAAILFGLAFARFGDLPPFVFYLVLPVVSVSWL